MRNLIDIRYDTSTKEWVVENDEVCVTNMDLRNDIKAIRELLSDPANASFKELINDVIGPDTTLREYQTIRDMHDRGIAVNVSEMEIEVDQTQAFGYDDHEPEEYHYGPL
jgi:hypothetical protein